MGINIQQRISLRSSIVFTDIPEGTFSEPIQFNPKKMYHYGSVFQVDQITGDVMEHTQLADISTIVNTDGVPTGLPANRGWGYSNYDSGLRNLYNHPYHYVTVDLESTYNLDYAYVYYNETSEIDMAFWSSENGADWKLLNSVTTTMNTSWLLIEFNDSAIKGNIKYFKFGVKGEVHVLNGLVLYGRKSKEILLKGNKGKRFVRHRKLEETIGTNTFYLDDPERVEKISSNTRFYVEPDWFMGETLRVQGSGEGLAPADIYLKFETSHMGSIDQMLQGFKNTKQHCTWTPINMPLHLRNYYVQGARELKPVDPGLDYLDIEITTNPMSYTHMARIFYNVAARYGKNKNVDVSMLKVGPGERSRVGMDLLYCIEPGNEMDGYWKANGWFSPEEMAAYMSACYDGHMGQMGAGFGIKTADPSLLVSLPGLVVATNVSYVHDMILWWDTYRGKGDYPMDIINLHHYNSTSENQVVGQGAYGLQPEKGSMMSLVKEWSDFRDIYAPSSELWLSETGYDEHLGGQISPNYPTHGERTKYKSMWLIRIMVATKASGIDVVNQFWFNNTGVPASYEIDMQEYDPTMFKTCQYMDVLTDGPAFWGYSPLSAYWYMYHFRNETKGFYFSHFIMMDGVTKINETIFNTNDNRIWAVAFRNPLLNIEIIIAWLGSGTFATLNTSLRVNENVVKTVIIDNAEIRQGDAGETKLVPAAGSVGNYTISVMLSECPQIIYSSFVGTKKPDVVTDIRQQRLTTGEILVVWNDTNIEHYTTQIQRSTSVNGTYTTIFQGDIYEASYVDISAAIGTTYYYKINLLP